MVEWVEIGRQVNIPMTYTNEDNTMKIEAGKYYRTRDGRKVGPMRFDDYGGKYPFDENKGTMLWSDIGKCDEGQEKDLIAEWQDASTMTNYNDGNWHGWNGGECPVHPKTVVEVLFEDGSGAGEKENAGSFGWMFHPTLVVFRVVKEHKEPREFWVKGNVAVDDKSKIAPWENYNNWVHVREVME